MFNNVNVLTSANFTLEDSISSPFAVYANETITHEKKYPVPIAPTSIDHEILKIVAKTLFCTSALIIVELSKSGIPYEVTNVRNRIIRMCEAEFLMGYRFRTEGGRSSHIAIRLGWRGIGYLKANGIQPRLGTYLAKVSEDPVVTKKILSAVQYVIRTNVPMDEVSFCQPVFVPCKNPTKKSTRIFRPQAIVQKADRTVFIESIRQDQGWEANILEKLGRIESVCRAHSMNIEVKSPALVLVAENSTHLRMLLRMIEKRGCSIPVYFTADSLVYANPETCLYQLPKSKSFWTYLFAC